MPTFNITPVSPISPSNSYGSAAGVASLTKVFTNAGSFDTTTLPTLANVVSWIDEVSAIVNTALAAQGFTIPVSNATAILALQNLVQQYVSDLCHAANTSGRFFTERALERGVSAMTTIRKEIYAWVEDNASGLENLGAARAGKTGGGEIGFRDMNERGTKTFPIFQRDGFGNTFDNADS
jgi:hypothetical protein